MVPPLFDEPEEESTSPEKITKRFSRVVDSNIGIVFYKKSRPIHVCYFFQTEIEDALCLVRATYGWKIRFSPSRFSHG